MTGTSATQESMEQQTPVVLPADAPIAPVNSEVFCKTTQPACSQSYHDIVYVTGQRKFWLLPKLLTEQLGEAAATLQQKTVDTDKASRMSRIAESGLMDYFITPGPDAFLDASDENSGERRRYLEAKDALAEEAQVQEGARKRWNESRSQGDSTAAMQAERELFRSQQRTQQLETEVAQLEAISNERAEGLGYVRENGHFYTPRTLQARDAVDVYIAERDKALAHSYESFDPGSRTISTAWDHLRHYKTLYQKLVETGEFDSRALRGTRINILNLEDQLAPYINAIVELAECGIAVAEFALSPDDQYQGTEDFQAYVRLLGSRRALEQRIEERYAQWTTATGGRAAPPGMLFTELQEAWHQLNDEAESIKATAEARVRELLPPRLFLWEPESYRPKPIERLARANIPLREFSLASASQALQHLSLVDLAKQGFSELGQAFKELKALPKAVAKEADADKAFSDWLTQQGAHSFEDQDQWFDEDGLFLPERFFAVLDSQGFEVASLQGGEARSRWGETLKAMIFEDRQLRKLMLFDNSPQAQFVRCLLPPGASLHQSTAVEGPQWHKGPIALRARAYLEVAAWRGEVDLFNFTIPERSQAQPIEPSYTAYDGSERTFSFGKLSFSFSAKAWGFAGASLMLTREFMLDQKTNYTSLVGVDIAERNGDLGKYDLFVGAQVGCRIKGVLDWCPPPSVLPPAPVPNRTQVDNWQTLAKLEAELVAAAGGNVSGSVHVQLRNGRFLVSIKGSLILGTGFKGYMTFEVGYQGVVALLELLRVELAINRNQRPIWIENEAFEFAKKLCLFGALGMELPFIYVRGYAMVNDLYRRLTDVGRGGAIAHTLVMDKNQHVMRSWVRKLQPAAFGPLLMALSSTPKAFSVGEGNSRASFNDAQAHLIQQQAIERCLSWVAGDVNADRQFEDAVMLMNRDGIKPENAGQAYCENRLRLDSFMAERVGSIGSTATEGERVRASYRQLSMRLGVRLDGYCEYRSEYHSTAFVPTPSLQAFYKGPNID